MGKLTTHVLDTARGQPACGLRLQLFRLDETDRTPTGRTLIAEATTNKDGRAPVPLLEGAGLSAGQYELVYEVGRYLDSQGLDLPDPKFLDEVLIRFGISNPDENYHVPLLVSPFGYSTYRGS